MELRTNHSVEFFEGTHQYFCGEDELIGVTTLMKKHGLSPDYTGIRTSVLNAAAERGSQIHKLLEDYDNGKTVVETAELKAYKKLGLQVIASEYLVSDNKLVASSIDKVLSTGEECMVDLGDVKTTSTLHKDALAWQLSIYAYLFELQNPKIKVRNLYGIHVRNGKAVLHQVNRIPTKHIVALFRAEAKGDLYEDDRQKVEATSILNAEDILTLADCESQLLELSAEIERLKGIEAAFKDKLYEAMMKQNLDEMTLPGGIFKLKRPYTKKSIDTKKLAADHPEIAEKYMKETLVKGNVTFNLL